MLRITGSQKPLAISVIYGLDTETYPDGSFCFGWVVGSDNSSFFFDKKENLIRWLQEKKAIKTYVCGMNIAYDINTLFPDWNPKRIINGNHLITLDFSAEIRSHHKEIEDKKKSHHGNKHIIVLDIGNFIQNKSMKEIARDFGFNYIDIHDIKNARINEACFSHAQSSMKTMIYIQEKCAEFHTDLKITAPSCAHNIFKHRFLKKEDEIWDNNHPQEKIEEMKRISLNTYTGGAVEIFKKGKRKTITVDVVSMYPAQMLKPLPDMNYWAHISEKSDINMFWKNGNINNREGMALIDMVIPEMHIPPFLYQNFLGHRISKTGKFIGWLNFVDVRYAIKCGCKINSIIEIYSFKRKENFFKDYINTFFELKKNRASKSFAKLMLNSLYGKFGQKYASEIQYREIESGDEIDISKSYEYDDKKYSYEKTTDKILPGHSYPLISSYITSYARVFLHESIMKIGSENVVYSDTDSIDIENLTSEEIGLKIKLGKNMGDFEVKRQGTIDCRSPKYYRHRKEKSQWEYTIKGISRREKEEFWKTEDMYIQKPVKYFSAIRRGLKINEWLAFRYIKRAHTQKRFFRRDGTSRPYSDNDYELQIS